MSTMTNIDVLTDEWVKKLHFENRVDLNLQIPSSGESIKVEVGDIPTERIPQLDMPSFDDTKQKNHHKARPDNQANSIPTSDSYLSSLVSSAKSNPTGAISSRAASPTPTTASSTSPTVNGSCQGTQDCSCYKCQRQRRRAGTRNRTLPTEPPLAAMGNATTTTVPTAPQKQETHSYQQRTHDLESMSPIIDGTTNGYPITDASKPSSASVKRNASFMLRKNPSMVSYERHLPRPTYSQQDSIYRGKRSDHKASSDINDGSQQQDLNRYNKDSYEISWQDETGDDLLTSLRTFQTIFDEKPHGSEGLSDLLETRAQELKRQQIEEKEQLANQQRMEPNRPPRRSDCLTLSYRDGPAHKHLTLYHTMKMNGPTERMAAYGRALQHCVRADSGLTSWVERQSNQPPPSAAISNHRPNFTLKKSTKRSILHLPGRKQKNTAEDLWLRTNKLTDSPITQREGTLNDTESAPIDVLSTANALMPSAASNQSAIRATANNKPYDHVDTPSRPVARSRNSVDKDSLTSLDMEQSRPTKSAKIWSSLGRKASKSRSNAPSLHSIEKYQPPASIKEAPEPFEKALDDLCQIMTHVDRAVLQTYLEQANGDYMKTLSVIRAEVTSGKL